MFKDKNDITTLPFDKIAPRIKEKREQLESIMLNNMVKAIASMQDKKIAELTNQLSTNLESSDGVEESIKEAFNFSSDDVELTAEQKDKIRKEARDIILASFINHCNLGSKHSWVLPQMIATFGTWVAVRGENGLYSPKLTYVKNVENNQFNHGLWYVATSPRSALITVDSKSGPMYKLKQYNQLVPLILAGFKQYQNIKYNDWDRNEIAWLVDEELGRAMKATVPDLSNEEINEIRAIAHTTKSGNRAGKQGSPITTASLYHLGDYTKYDLTSIPKLAMHMIIQSWIAHPANRAPNVHILDPRDWDAVPKPSVSTSILGKDEYDWGTVKQAGIYDNPW